jgi:hypothetical protein
MNVYNALSLHILLYEAKFGPSKKDKKRLRSIEMKEEPVAMSLTTKAMDKFW